MSQTEPVAVLLTATSPMPACSCDIPQFGTFVLTPMNETSQIPDVSKLAVVVYRPNQDDGVEEEWKEVSIFQDASHLSDSIPEEITKVLRTSRRLQARLDEAATRRLPDVSSSFLLTFLTRCESVFRELTNLLSATTLRAGSFSSQSIPSLSCIRAFFQQLQELDQQYGSGKHMDVVQHVRKDLAQCSLQYIDGAGRSHMLLLEISVAAFPKECPKCTVQLPIQTWQPDWRGVQPESSNIKRRRLADTASDEGDSKEIYGLSRLYADFMRQVDGCQDLWAELDDLDHHTIVLEPSTLNNTTPCRSIAYRRIVLTESTSVTVKLNPLRPRDVPLAIRWIGSNTLAYRQKYHAYLWSDDVSVRQNLQRCLDMDLPCPAAPRQAADETLFECNICYTHELPLDEGHDDRANPQVELPKAKCDTCDRHYHDSCLREWLQSLSSSRQSFDRILGTCPYCKEYISVALQSE